MTKTPFLSNLQLNPRLLKIAQLVTKSNCLADIGTDHAYIPIWSVLNGVADHAIASDINKGPVDRAAKNVRAFGLADKISLRLGSGLSTITPGEVDTIVIAGMGGILISDILDAASDTVSCAKQLILQPMTAVKELREYLSQNSFTLTGEYLAAEDEKIYNIICTATGGKTHYSEKELFLGKALDKNSPDLYAEHKHRILEKYKKRLSGLEKSDLEENKIAAEEVRRILELIK